jgi:hypothetical protein
MMFLGDIMDILGGHLLFDQATRQLFAGPYLQDDEDTKTPAKEPAPGSPFDERNFRDDQAPQKPAPVKPHPRGIPPRPISAAAKPSDPAATADPRS